MKRKKFVRAVCAVLAVIMLAGIFLPVLTTSFAETAKEKLDRLQAELNDINKNISANKNNLSKQEQNKKYYQQQKNTISAQIETMKTEIAAKEEELRIKAEEVGQKILEVEHTKELFEDRLVAMYTSHNKSSLSTLLGVSNFAEALRFTENLQKISENDTNLIERLRIEQTELEAQKAEVEQGIADLQAQKDALDQKVAELSSSIQATNNAISATEANLAAQQEAYGATYEQWKAAEEEFQKWVSQNGKVDFEWGGGPFGKPIQSYTSISSNYGYRTIFGRQEFHRGIDFAAPAGTPIYAAESGMVSTIAHWSYGTCVKINHGSGLVTIYGHMSARAAGITDGVYVSKGQLIGYVGSTGNSTGNHLHFEVNLNGSPQNPASYL